MAGTADKGFEPRGWLAQCILTVGLCPVKKPTSPGLPGKQNGGSPTGAAAVSYYLGTAGPAEVQLRAVGDGPFAVGVVRAPDGSRLARLHVTVVERVVGAFVVPDATGVGALAAVGGGTNAGQIRETTSIRVREGDHAGRIVD